MFWPYSCLSCILQKLGHIKTVGQLAKASQYLFLLDRIQIPFPFPTLTRWGRTTPVRHVGRPSETSITSTATDCPTQMRSPTPAPFASSASRGKTGWAIMCAHIKAAWRNLTSVLTVPKPSLGINPHIFNSSISILLFVVIHYVFGVSCFQAGPPQQSRSTGALYRETVQVHGNVIICLLDFN